MKCGGDPGNLSTQYEEGIHSAQNCMPLLDTYKARDDGGRFARLQLISGDNRITIESIHSRIRCLMGDE